MHVYTYSEARQNFADLLDQSIYEEVIVRRRDGNQFRIVPDIIAPSNTKKSPLDIPGINCGITLEQTLQVLNDIREDRP
jgi:hypothetical protein